MSCWCLAVTSFSLTIKRAVEAATKEKARTKIIEAEKTSRPAKSDFCRAVNGRGWLREVIEPTEFFNVNKRCSLDS
jgi:hypothetical protein